MYVHTYISLDSRSLKIYKIHVLFIINWNHIFVSHKQSTDSELLFPRFFKAASFGLFRGVFSFDDGLRLVLQRAKVLARSTDQAELVGWWLPFLLMGLIPQMGKVWVIWGIFGWELWFDPSIFLWRYLNWKGHDFGVLQGCVCVFATPRAVCRCVLNWQSWQNKSSWREREREREWRRAVILSRTPRHFQASQVLPVF